jgi:hypothetical protein
MLSDGGSFLLLLLHRFCFLLKKLGFVYLVCETGISNCAGTLAAIVSTIGTGYFVQWLGSFQAFLTVTAFLYFATTVFWLLFATGERVF